MPFIVVKPILDMDQVDQVKPGPLAWDPSYTLARDLRAPDKLNLKQGIYVPLLRSVPLQVITVLRLPLYLEDINIYLYLTGFGSTRPT